MKVNHIKVILQNNVRLNILVGKIIYFLFLLETLIHCNYCYSYLTRISNFQKYNHI